MNIHGISLTLSSFEKGLWWDSDWRDYNPDGWGVRLHIVAGSFVRPVAKPWGDKNPWQEKAWFTMRLPWIILPFISIAFRGYGFYLGGKVLNVDPDEPWARPEEYGTQKITFSFTVRSTRWT